MFAESSSCCVDCGGGSLGDDNTMEGMKDRGRWLIVMTKQELVIAPMEANVMRLVSCDCVSTDVGDSVAGDVRKRIETGVKRNGL